MFKNKSENGNNICGIKIYEMRKSITPRMSQRALADKMQLEGIDLDKNAIQRIECGKRFVTDIELLSFAKIFNVSCDQLLMSKYKNDTNADPLVEIKIRI